MKLALVSLALASAPASAVTPLPVVNEARAQLSEKHRDKAIALLIDAIKSEWNFGRRGELEIELNKTASIFLSNEGQRLYELAESARHGGTAGYLANYEAALKLEPLNSKVISGYILGLMAAKKCKATKDPLGQLEASNPFSEEYKLLSLKVALCNDPAAITNSQELELEGNKELILYKKTVRAQVAMAKGQTETGLNFTRQANKIDDKYATAYFVAWRALSKDDSGLDEAQKYLSLCKNVTSEVRRRYTFDPELCANVEEVEEFLRKEEASTNEK